MLTTWWCIASWMAEQCRPWSDAAFWCGSILFPLTVKICRVKALINISAAAQHIRQKKIKQQKKKTKKKNKKKKKKTYMHMHKRVAKWYLVQWYVFNKNKYFRTSYHINFLTLKALAKFVSDDILIFIINKHQVDISWGSLLEIPL